MNAYLRQQIFFILLILGLSIRLNLIGSISITELFVLIQTPKLFKWLTRQPFVRIKKISYMFIALLIIQIIAEVMVGNSLRNSVRGLMVTLMTLLLILYFVKTFLADFHLIKLIPIAMLIRVILLGDQFGYAESAGEGTSTYFKFYIAPIILWTTLIIIPLLKKHTLLILFMAAILIIIGGARSMGFSLLFASVGVAIVRINGKITIGKYVPFLITAFILIQMAYAYIYVPNVVSGKWGSDQNREQLAKIGNSRNIFKLIEAARTDFFVSYIAFMDKPLWGHGSWAIDHTLKYNKILVRYLDKDAPIAKDQKQKLIPVHSVVMGMGTRNGIFAFLLFLYIFLYIMGMAIRSLDKDTPHLEFYIYYIISIFIALMFGTPTALKNMGGIRICNIHSILSLYAIEEP